VEYKAIPILSGTEIQDRTVDHLFAVMGRLDDFHDRIWPGAFEKTIKERGARVKALWQHNNAEPPIGVPVLLRELGRGEVPAKVTALWPDVSGALLGRVRYLETPRGDEVLTGIAQGAITENSIGYDPVKFDFEELNLDETGQNKVLARNLREVRLWDISPVNWGAQEAAIMIKAAVPYKDTGKADEGTAWSAPGLGDFTSDAWDALNGAEQRRIMAHFAFAANMPPATFGDLKLPHHAAAKSGVGPVVWRGVAAAMGALMGARGGVKIPDADRQAVYSHLARHYGQFNKEPPEFKLLELSAMVAAVLEPGALKEGRVLSKGNLERLKNALAVLNEILLAAEPSSEEGAKALTARRALVRRAILEAEIAARTG
jgi:HK97 family phage prohead protease